MSRSRKAKPILCLDFDGVVHGYSSGWQGIASIPDPPVPGALAFIEAMIADGWQIHIHSSRSRSLRGRWAMKSWLRRHLNAYTLPMEADDIYTSIRWPWFKPSAAITLDDRAITFTGQFPTRSELKAFEPWYRKK